jgi:hypothetical protein
MNKLHLISSKKMALKVGDVKISERKLLFSFIISKFSLDTWFNLIYSFSKAMMKLYE